MSAAKFVQFGFLLFFALRVHALVFPLLPDANGAYDVNHNALHSYSELWRTNHHAMANFHGACAVPIAPRWFITAGHVTNDKTSTNWINDDFTRYYVEEIHPLDSDLALVKVDRPVSHYVEIRKEIAVQGEIVTVYGQSAAAKDPLMDSQLKVCGWKLAPLNYFPFLRWGHGRLSRDGSFSLAWPFTDSDRELDLNCAASATNDSGGGIYIGEKLAGIITGGVWKNVRTNISQPMICDGTALPMIGHVFDGSTIFNCDDNGHPETFSAGGALQWQLDRIFENLSPPVRMYAGATKLMTNDGTWEPFPPCSGCSLVEDASNGEMDSSSIANPPSPEIYKSALVLAGGEAGVLNFSFDELVKYEHYNLRLHFAAIGPCSAPEVCREEITVNGKTVSFDPYAGPRKASELALAEIQPDEQNRISIQIRAANPAGIAIISGLELELVPSWLLQPPNAKWQSLVSFQPPAEINAIAFGNGRFVAVSKGAPYYSDDQGRSWLPGNKFAPANDVAFGNGMFVAPGAYGTEAIFYSSDGRNWKSAGVPEGWYGAKVLFGNGTFLIVGSYGISAVSTNGSDWRFQSISPQYLLSTPLTFGDGRFVALDSFERVWFSEDGINWKAEKAEAPVSAPPYTLGYGNGLYFATPFTGSVTPMLISTNALSWTLTQGRLPYTPPGAKGQPAGLNGVFVAVNSGLMTTDFADWRPIPGLPRSRPTALDFGDSTYILTAPKELRGTNLFIARGPTLETLVPVENPFPLSIDYSCIAVRDQTIVALCSSEGFQSSIIVSTNAGKDFDIIAGPEGAGALTSVVASPGGFLAVGAGGTIIESADGQHWTDMSSGTREDLNTIFQAAGTWLVAGEHGTLLAARDGSVLSRVNSGTLQAFRAITFGNGVFVATGNDGTVLSSTNGFEWFRQKLGTNDLTAAAFGNGVFVVNGGNHVSISADGFSWRDLNFLPMTNLVGMVWADGLFFTTSGKTNGYVSTNGVVWSQMTLPGRALALASAEGSIWASGENALLSRLQLTTPARPMLSGTLNPDGTFTLDISVQRRGDYAILSSPLSGIPAWQPLTVLTNIASTIKWTDRRRLENARMYQIRQE